VERVEGELIIPDAIGIQFASRGRDLLREKTVRNHVSNIFMKLQVRDRATAIVRAREAGLGVRPARTQRAARGVDADLVVADLATLDGDAFVLVEIDAAGRVAGDVGVLERERERDWPVSTPTLLRCRCRSGPCRSPRRRVDGVAGLGQRE
jgi:hypothetical protein